MTRSARRSTGWSDWPYLSFLCLGMLGGLIAAVSEVVDLPTLLVATGLILLIGAVGAFFAFAYRQANGEGGGVWRGTRQGVRVALRRLFDLA